MLKVVLWIEWLKVRHSLVIWLVIFLIPLFLTIVGVTNYATNIHVFEEADLVGWMGTWTQIEFLYGMVLCPVLSSVFVALLCRFEHSDGGWKQLHTFPIPKEDIYFSKMIVAWLLVGITNIVFLTYLFIIGNLMGVEGDFPLLNLLGLFFGGWLASLPLISMQLWLSTQWKNFVLPIAINFAFVMPNIFVTSSKYGKYYPWSQPAYAMNSENQLGLTHSLQDFYITLIIMFILFSLAGFYNFFRAEVK